MYVSMTNMGRDKFRSHIPFHYISFFLSLLLYFSSAYGQSFYLSPSIKTIQFHTPLPDSINIAERHVLQSYLKAFADTLALDVNVDFTLEMTENSEYPFYIKLKEPDKYDSLIIEYAIFPERIFEEYSIFEPFEMTDTLKVSTINRNWENLLLDSHSLNITGNKTISVSASNHDMLGINQSLFLRIDGELSSNVFIQAQLNDSQSPITPEGDSRELSSLDEVFFKVYGREYEIAFGDLDLNITGTQFINFNPKFEGLRISYFDRNSITGAIAISSSKSAYISINGVEGKQGPYYLRPDGVHHNVQILPGTESIWLNGVSLYRGSDYRIDYSEGSIEFTLNHFISENSRIQAAFQYSDEYYRKTAMLESSDLRIGDRLRFRTAVIYQRDDSDRPLAESLSNEDKKMLKEAGDSKPLISGEIYIGGGLGLYKKVEAEKVIYIYAPGEPDADYDVRFTWVGNGKGDYDQITPSRFDYVGESPGSFLPIREIVAPEHRANYNISLNYSHDFFSIYAESLFSEYDKNTFSNIDNDDNFSYIHHFQADFFPDWDNFQPVLSTWYRYRHPYLYTFANIRNPNEAYQFYTFAQPDTLSSSEIYINLKTLTYDLLSQETSYKIVNYQNMLKQSYLVLNQSMAQTRFLPALSYKFNYADSKNSMPLDYGGEMEVNHSQITIHEPSVQYRYSVATLRGNARFFEENVTQANSLRSELLSGNRLNQYSTQLAFDNILNSGIALSYEREDNNIFTGGYEVSDSMNASIRNLDSWQKLRKSDTWTMQGYSQFNRQYFTALYSHRVMHDFNAIPHLSHPTTHEAEEHSTISKFDIAEIRSVNSLFNSGLQLNISYMLRNTEFFPKARELSYVGQGAGFYDSTGVWTEKGDWDWITVIVGDPSRSIEVNANLNAFTYPANFVNRGSEIYEFLNKINLETNISIMEQTENKDRLKVYFLFPEAIMNDLSIYSQQEWRQSIWYNILRNKWISRYTYRNNRTQDNRFQDQQSFDQIDHEVSLRLLRVFNSDFEQIFRLSNQTDSRYDMESDTRSSEFNVRTSFGNNLIFNTGIGYESEKVVSRTLAQTIDRYIFSEDIMYFLGQRYRFNGNITIRYNVVEDPISTYLPFDKQQGMNLRWVAGLNYRMNRITTLNLDYSGYKHPIQEAFHQVKMEVRAEF